MSRNGLRFALLGALALGMSSACAKLVGDFDFVSSSGAGGMTSSSASAISASSAMTMCTIAADCSSSNDCVTWTCTNHTCASVPVTSGTTCAGGVCDDIGVCVGCLVQGATTFGCTTDEYCFNEACASCSDTTQNGDETDADCGGVHCVPCADKKMCKNAGDCVSGLCDTAVSPSVCISCTDGNKDGNETDVDCGGSLCSAKCAIAQGCLAAADCASMECPAGKCTACHDGIQNGHETSVDCGGSCPTCNGGTCTSAADCKSSNCVLGICCDTFCQLPTGSKCQSCALSGQVGTCTNIPSGVDGSPTCGYGNVCDGAGGPCAGLAISNKGAVGQLCSGDVDCFNGNCKAGFCRLKPGDHCDASVECDTDFCSVQHTCATCTGAGDCATTQCGGGNCCLGGFCKLPNSALCGHDVDCAIGHCVTGACGLPNNVTCTGAADCYSGHCNSMSKCASCASDGECGANGKCFIPGTIGVCLRSPGDYCFADPDCVSSSCLSSPIFGQCM